MRGLFILRRLADPFRSCQVIQVMAKGLGRSDAAPPKTARRLNGPAPHVQRSGASCYLHHRHTKEHGVLDG